MAKIVIVAGFAASEFPLMVSLIQRLREHGHYALFAGVSVAERIVSEIGVDFFPISESAPEGSLPGNGLESLPAMTREAILSLLLEQSEGLAQMLQFAAPAVIILPVQLAIEAVLIQSRFGRPVALLAPLPSVAIVEELQYSVRNFLDEPRWYPTLQAINHFNRGTDIFSHILECVHQLPLITIDGSPRATVSNCSGPVDQGVTLAHSLEQLIQG